MERSPVKKQKILICDDNAKNAIRWSKKLQEVASVNVAATVESASKERLKKIVNALRARQSEVRESANYKTICEIDDYDILICDYDLIEIDEAGRVTGEQLAGLARVFSKCGYIVVLNQRPELDFDLTMRIDFEGRADLSLPLDHVFSPGLWGSVWSNKTFRPWHWPNLLEAPKRQKARERELKGRLGDKIAKFFDIPETIASKLPRAASEHLSITNDPVKITFQDFLESGSLAADPKDREGILKNEEISIRVAAARVARWLENALLVPQDILIDVPHLIRPLPFLLKGPVKEINRWNDVVDLDAASGITATALASHKFKRTNWLSRPAYWWPTIQNDKKLVKKKRDFDLATLPDFVFREDTSDFGSRSTSEEFVPEMTSAFDRRYIAKLPRKQYGPMVRLAM